MSSSPWSPSRLPAFLVLCCGFASCSTNRSFGEADVLRLQAGFTREQVIEVLGEPAERLIASEMSGAERIDEFGAALAREDPSRVEGWIYTDVDVVMGGPPPIFTHRFGDSTYVYAMPQEFEITGMRFANLHFLDGRLLRNERRIGPDDLARVRDGMTREELIGVLGQPLMRSDGWIFHAEGGGVTRIPFRFEDGRIRGWSFQAR